MHIDARVNGTPLELDLQDVAVDDTAQVEIRFTAKIPDLSPTFTWRSTSTPIVLEPSRAEAHSSALWLTHTRIGHALAMGALVVYVLRRRRSAHRLAGG